MNLDHVNPIDSAEEFLNAQKWNFDRLSEDQIYLSVEGDKGSYKILFMWDEDNNSLQFCCETDIHLPETSTTETLQTLANVNEQLWIGHFDLSGELEDGCLTPCYRYNHINFVTDADTIARTIHEIFSYALQECERLHDAFAILANDNHTTHAMMDLALAKAQGCC